MNITELCSKHSPKFGTDAYKSGEWKVTLIPISFEFGTLPIGTEFRDFQSQNFGYVVLKEYPKDAAGNPIERRVWRV